MDKHLENQVDAYIATVQDQLVEDWKALVRIRSVSEPDADGYPYGRGCARVLEKAVALSLEKGFSATNHGYRYGTAGVGNGRREIGVFSHLDVVEEGEGWIHSPFDPVEREGWLIGRGAGDNKSAAVLGLYLLQAFGKGGFSLHNSRLLLYFGCNEEKGMADIDQFVSERPMPDCSLVPDLFFPVCHGEKGSMRLKLHANQGFETAVELQGGLAENMVPESAQAVFSRQPALLLELEELARTKEAISLLLQGEAVTVLAKGKSAMSSMPEGSVNAIGVLAGFLSQVTCFSEKDRSLWDSIAKLTGSHDGVALGIDGKDALSGELTCVCVSVEMRDDRPELCYNIRYPVTGEGDRVREEATAQAERLGWEVSQCRDNPPLYLPAEHPYVQFLCEAYQDITGRQREPYVIGGGTYARKLERAVAFGAGNGSKNPFLPPGHGGVHQPDESRPISGILEALKVYILTVLKLDALSDEEFSMLWSTELQPENG